MVRGDLQGFTCLISLNNKDKENLIPHHHSSQIKCHHQESAWNTKGYTYLRWKSMNEHGGFMYISAFLYIFLKWNYYCYKSFIFIYQKVPNFHVNLALKAGPCPISFPQSPIRAFLTVNCWKSLSFCVLYWRTVIMKISTNVSQLKERKEARSITLYHIAGFADHHVVD